MDEAWAALIQPLPYLWPAALVIAFAALVVRLGPLRAWWAQRAIGLDQIDELSGEQFERFLARFFARAGWQVEEVGGRGDFGADLIVTYQGYRTAVQAKRSASPVGVAAIQEVVGARSHYDCEYAMVVTNSHYTAAAQTLATSCGVELWDRDDLQQQIERYSR